MSMRGMVLVGMLAAVAACGSFSLHGPQSVYGPGMEPTRQRGVSPVIAQAGAMNAGQTKRVCRTAGTEPGWVAIDYVADSSGCGSISTKTNAHPVAILLDYRTFRVGSEIEICAPERIPNGWNMAGWLRDANHCADDNQPDDTTHMTVKRIRRVY